MQLREASILTRASRSLIGHIIISEIVWTFVMLLTFWETLYFDGGPTVASVLRLLLTIVGAGLIPPILFWYTVSRPLIRRIEKGS